jgi:hypothetical protein
MIQEIKELVSSPLTHSLKAMANDANDKIKIYTYVVTNGAMDVMFEYAYILKDGETTHRIDIYTRHTAKTLEIRPDGSDEWQQYEKITNYKDVKELLSIIKSKFFPTI